jgi:Matrixin/Bacterial pre-peptidase C-terminal domain
MKPSRTLVLSCAVLIAILTVFGMLLPVLRAQAAVSLKYGQAANGTFSGTQKIEYTFLGKAGDKVWIHLNALGGDTDPFLELYDPSGKLIGQDDNTGGKDNALISGLVLQADGTYKVVASNKRQGTSGKYSLIINPESPQGPIFYDGPKDKEAYQLSKPWDHTNITYRVMNTLSDFSQQDTLTIIREALQSWANVTPLKFQQVTSGRSDITIQFAPIDGPMNVLGETCPPSSPCSGQVQFDSDEPWTLREPNGYQDISFLAVASHEFGHAIGLLHSSDSSALMYPSYSPYNLKPGPDDIRGAQRLYGAGTGGVSNPTSAPPQPTGPSGQPQVRGAITDQKFANFWDFDVDAGDTLTITMKRASGDLDSFLVLLDANNHILAYDDDSAGGKDATLRNIRLPQRGTYTVAATRFQQAQGYTRGDYILSIDYGTTTAGNPPPAAPTTANQPPGQPGKVKVSSGQASALQQYPSLDSMADTPFNDTLTPSTQTSTATVQREQTYVWETNWCAKDQATLNNNLQNMVVTFAVEGRAVDPSLITKIAPPDPPNGLSCMEFFVLLSDWSPGQVSLTKTMTLRSPVFDGMTVYPQGDYVFQYTVNVT